MAKWEEAFDHQVDLFTFWSSPTGREFAHGYVHSVSEANPEEDRAVRAIYGDLAERARQALIGADPIWVSPDIMTLVEAAAKTFVPEPLLPTDLITPHGFMWLPRPLTMVDIHGKKCSYRALSWFPATYTFKAERDESIRLPAPEPGLFLMLYHYTGDPDDYSADPRDRQMERRFNSIAGGLVLTHVTPWVFGHGYPDSESDTIREEIASGKGCGHPDHDSSLHDPHALEGTLIGMGEIARWVQVIFRMMNQTISIRSHARPPRQARKRAERSGLMERRVVVVTLRRGRDDSYHENEHDPVEWSHRWIVSGHWRNQWFPSISQHRQIWIGAYVKGPEDAPLLVRPLRAFKFAR